MTDVMLILPGIADKDHSTGLLDRPSALAYAKFAGYEGRVLEIAGAAYANSPQVVAALKAFRADVSINAFYGFSGGAFNMHHVLEALTDEEKQRVMLVVILGAPENPASLYAGPWQLVYRTNPPTGHMDGPRALYAETITKDAEQQFG